MTPQKTHSTTKSQQIQLATQKKKGKQNQVINKCNIMKNAKQNATYIKVKPLTEEAEARHPFPQIKTQSLTDDTHIKPPPNPLQASPLQITEPP